MKATKTKVSINYEDIKRRGNTILLGQGRTATEGWEGSLPRLSTRENGKRINYYRGSSLYFSHPLTPGDKRYLASLGSDEENIE